MSLTSGTRLGSYEIHSVLGAGGMGEVYRARDTQLGREVAIKVLRKEVADDPDRMARFEREARVLASLNHTHIATLFGFFTERLTGDPDASSPEGDRPLEPSFLVMELVEGDTLAERVSRGPLSVEEALPLFIQIAEGLEAAHERGVIHRDLKPANIKPGADGRPLKILDFGLAKATLPDTHTEDGTAQSMSPTLSLAATQRGEIMGTAAYMSPEQARGRAVDKRTDIWAFGVCLFEALSGERAFRGDDAMDVIASVLTQEPRWDSLPASGPPALCKLLQRCLEKDPRRRLRDIGDARLELEELLDSDSSALALAPTAPPPNRAAAPLRLAVAALAGAAITALTLWGTRAEPPRPIVRSILTGSQSPPIRTEPFLSLLAISPDGNSVAYETLEGIYIRTLGELKGRRLTEPGGRAPTFSPGGQWLAYFGASDNTLYKVPVRGGQPVVISRSADRVPLSASWGDNDTILFTLGNSETDLLRISADGGEPEAIDVVVPEGVVDIRWPEYLPGSKAALVTLHDAPTQGRARLAVVDLESGELKPLLADAGRAVLTPNGYLVYGLGGTLMAVRFDLGKREIRGAPIAVVEQVMTKGLSHGGDFAVAQNGSLAYASGLTENAVLRTVVRWRDRNGAMTPTSLGPAAWSAPRFSLDGRHLALAKYEDDNSDIYVWDIERDSLTRITLASGSDMAPLWSRDGEALYFASNRGGPWNIYRRSLNATDDGQLVWASAESMTPAAITPDGAQLMYASMGASMQGGDIGVVALPDGGSSAELVASEFKETEPSLSPDGRWLAYSSDRFGREEIFVQPFPDVANGRWQVTTEGGRLPRWGPDGREILYRVPGSGALMRVAIATEGSLRTATPELIFVPPDPAGSFHGWDLHPDGERFVTLEAAEGEGQSPPELVLIQNFSVELERLVGAD